MMEKVQKPSNPECYMPLSEPFRTNNGRCLINALITVGKDLCGKTSSRTRCTKMSWWNDKIAEVAKEKNEAWDKLVQR
jgi:hypothetical protein